MFNLIILLLFSGIAVFLISRGTYLLKPFERVVIYRYGEPLGEKGPGLLFLNPFIDTVIRLKLGPIIIDIPPQEILSQDQIPIKISAKIQYRITSALKSVTEVKSSYQETQKITLEVFREYINKTPKDRIKFKEDSLNQNVKDPINSKTQAYGVEVEIVELREI